MNELNRARYEQGASFESFLQSTVENHDLWQAIANRARVPTDLLTRANAIGGAWKFLVLADDWCGDAVNSLPYVARLAHSVIDWDIRILSREADQELMDSHLTNGSRSIPVVILLDQDYEEHGWWGPRPEALQQWVMGPGKELAQEPRYREVRRWYSRDHGRTILEELLTKLESITAAIAQ